MPNYNSSPATRFKKDKSGNPSGRPKGSRNYKTLFREAYMTIAKDLRLGKDPDGLLVEILKRRVKEALKGNYNFCKDNYMENQNKQLKMEGKKSLVLTDKKGI
jgi:hypothetical protein